MNTRRTVALRTLAAALSVLLTLSACGAAAPAPGLRNQSAESAAAPGGAADSGSTTSTIAGADTDAAQVAARLIVRNASLTLIVQDTPTQMDAVTRMATDLGGYIAASSTQKFDQGLQAMVTLRVPAAQFDTALSQLHKMAVDVREEKISGEDVTAQYTDLNAQLTNLQAAEIQLRDIMSKTTKTEDVLSVFNQLTQKRGEIEQVKGRIQYLSQAAAMATINVTLIPDAMAQPLQLAGWRPEGVVKSAVQALIDALQTIATIAIWLIIVVIPIALILASPFILLFYILRRRSRNRKAQQQAVAKQ
ncbi:MAG: DUF4349 domain-containing protein [Chloroflexi bacterium]|nr:DUF4349 domain-containing protein [Chloroflexota bacterium]